MPKLYEYFGIVVYFFAREHEPIHVHGKYQDREMKAEIWVDQGVITEIRIRAIAKKKPLQEPQLSDFEKIVRLYAEEIVRKWADFFLFGKKVVCKQIKRRIK
ncbi:MAG: DUF4160 domain-containing protein [candidate division KSB1 bacterium]